MSHTLLVLAWVCWVAATITALFKRSDVALALIGAGLAFYITNPTFALTS